MKERLRRLGERWSWLGRALEVHERVGEINGGFVASAITVTVFLSIFPLLLVAISVVGFVAAGDTSVPQRIVDNLGLTGTAAQVVTDAVEKASQSRRAASIVGLVGLAWSGSAVAVALQHGVRAPWQDRPEGLRDRLWGIAWLAAAGIGFAAALFLGGVLNLVPDSVPGPLVTTASVAVSLLIEVGLFWWMFWGLGSRDLAWHDVLPGAVVAGVGFEVLKLVGTVAVPQLVSRSSALYGSIGVVFALLAWLALFARLIVYCSAINAVAYEARAGTVAVPVRVPRLPGREAVAATRGGIVIETGDDPPSIPDRV